ncbi:(+)-neomenthol dehydrogenase-like protein [Drosera capensis]
MQVNNAGILGSLPDDDTLRAREQGAQIVIMNGTRLETYELAEACINTNYNGVKRMIEAFIPLLELSDSPRIVNVSSSFGKLKHLNSEWAKGIFVNAEDHTEEKVDEVVKGFLQDFKDGSLVEKGWPPKYSAYIVSKAALNAYSRVLAKKYPELRINCVCPGYVKTDINLNSGILSVEDGAESPVRLALTPTPTSGLFFVRKEVSSYE